MKCELYAVQLNDESPMQYVINALTVRSVLEFAFDNHAPMSYPYQDELAYGNGKPHFMLQTAANKNLISRAITYFECKNDCYIYDSYAMAQNQSARLNQELIVQRMRASSDEELDRQQRARDLKAEVERHNPMFAS